MNKAILKGRLTKDIELRYTQAAEPKAYANFSVAINRFNDGVDFVNCSAWGKTAEFLGKYFKKGQEILLEGHIQVDVVDTDGVKTTFTKVVAERIEFCGSKSEATGVTSTPASTDTADDELPF